MLMRFTHPIVMLTKLLDHSECVCAVDLWSCITCRCLVFIYRSGASVGDVSPHHGCVCLNPALSCKIPWLCCWWLLFRQLPALLLLYSECGRSRLSHVCRGPAHVLRFYSDKFHWLMDAGLSELSWLDFSEERSPLPDFETAQLARCFGIPPPTAFIDV